jgi:hypothetical protein
MKLCFEPASGFTMTTTFASPQSKFEIYPSQWTNRFGEIQQAFEAMQSTRPTSPCFDRLSKVFDEAVRRAIPLQLEIGQEGCHSTLHAEADEFGVLRVVQSYWKTDTNELLSRREILSGPDPWERSPA